MRWLLGALLLMLATACSGSDEPPASKATSSPRSSASATPTEPPKPPRQRLKAAQLALSRATGGAYELDVGAEGLDHPLITERGRFDVLHEVMDVVRTVQDPTAEDDDERSSYVMRIRSSTDTRFLQMDNWGNWDGCWAEFDPEQLAGLGTDLAGLPNIPVPVSLVLHARLPARNVPAMTRPGGSTSVVPAASTPVEVLTVQTDGYTALQMLGVSARVLFALDAAAARTKVPVNLTFFYRYPDIVERVSIDGPVALAALRAADVDLDRQVVAFLGSAYARARFSRAPTPVEFDRPSPEQLLPSGATQDQTCPANLD